MEKEYRVLNDFGGLVGKERLSFSRGDVIAAKVAAKFPNLRSLLRTGFLEEVTSDGGSRDN